MCVLLASTDLVDAAQRERHRAHVRRLSRSWPSEASPSAVLADDDDGCPRAADREDDAEVRIEHSGCESNRPETPIPATGVPARHARGRLLKGMKKPDKAALSSTVPPGCREGVKAQICPSIGSSLRMWRRTCGDVAACGANAEKACATPL
jgi:hypothetical protein